MSNFIKNSLERRPKTMLTIASIVFLAGLLFKYLNQENEEIDWILGFILGFTAIFMLAPLQTLFKGRFN